MIELICTCPFCKKNSTVTVDFEGYLNYMMGARVQDAFPDLTPSERELLISGICDECWADI